MSKSSKLAVILRKLDQGDYLGRGGQSKARSEIKALMLELYNEEGYYAFQKVVEAL